MELRANQRQAIEESVRNDFENGVHFQATGTGKSRIAFEILLRYHIKYPKSNCLWLCEKKSILIHQFDRSKMEYPSIYQQFLVLNFTEQKPKQWVQMVNSSRVWRKPILIVINRTFLTFNERYKELKLPVHFIIHDECHSIVNDSTRLFYEYILSKNITTRVIGFSATPPLLKKPFLKILSCYSIADGIRDGIIVPPKMGWIRHMERRTLDSTELVEVVRKSFEDLIYQKVIVWCGRIRECLVYAQLFKEHFGNEYLISVDTSKGHFEYESYRHFEQRKEKAFLFCANKHREGSDIPHLDGCLFLDYVSKRYYKTFVQCIGRVLRVDTEKRKTAGFILDVNAKHATEIIERINMYLHLPSDPFPWKMSSEWLNDQIQMHRLEMIPSEMICRCPMPWTETESLLSYIQRKECLHRSTYQRRFQWELSMLEEKGLTGYLLKAVQILLLTPTISHITRGSCGSSLVCYVLGISHFDPVLYDIQFSRFFNRYRKTLPDIDFDFPYHEREDVFFKMETQWPNRIARISNHVYYRDKSAQRYALRQLYPNRSFISKEELPRMIQRLDPQERSELEALKTRMVETFKHYALHCGGVIYYPDGVPSELVLQSDKKKRIIPQVTLNKHRVSESQMFKIDILSSRGLTQLCSLYEDRPRIDFESFEIQTPVMDMLRRGDNLGITFAESVWIKKAFLLYPPHTLLDIAKCLSIIRPGAKWARLHPDKCTLIYDDDAITYIQSLLHCSEEEADKYRRAFTKRDSEQIAQFQSLIQSRSDSKWILKQLKQLSAYSFCKAHALSYAQLIYALAYTKYYRPKEFWESTLRHCHSMYKKWVHVTEAYVYGVESTSESLSIYSQSFYQKMQLLSVDEQLKQYGFWILRDKTFFPHCYCHSIQDDHQTLCFRGIIASKRYISRTKVAFYIGYDFQQYIDCYFENENSSFKHHPPNIIGIEATAVLDNPVTHTYRITEYQAF